MNFKDRNSEAHTKKQCNPILENQRQILSRRAASVKQFPHEGSRVSPCLLLLTKGQPEWSSRYRRSAERKTVPLT